MPFSHFMEHCSMKFPETLTLPDGEDMLIPKTKIMDYSFERQFIIPGSIDRLARAPVKRVSFSWRALQRIQADEEANEIAVRRKKELSAQLIDTQREIRRKELADQKMRNMAERQRIKAKKAASAYLEWREFIDEQAALKGRELAAAAIKRKASLPKKISLDDEMNAAVRRMKAARRKGKGTEAKVKAVR